MVNFYIEKSVNGVSVDLDGTDVRVLGSCLNIPLGLYPGGVYGTKELVDLRNRLLSNGFKEGLNNKICDKLREYPLVHINSTDKSIPHTINFSLRNIKSETFVHALDEKEIYISTKSACSSSNSMSNSVYALTKDEYLSNQSLRISLSYMTTEEEVDEFLRIFDMCIKKLDLGGKHEDN